MLLVCTRMSSVCHSYVLVCLPYVTGMYSYFIRMSLVCTRMSSVCHSYVLVCHPYVTRMYSYVFRMSLVCTRMSSVCHSYTHSYVLVCHPCVTRMWFYHEPWSFNATLNVHNLSLIFILTFANTNIKKRFNLCEN